MPATPGARTRGGAAQSNARGKTLSARGEAAAIEPRQGARRERFRDPLAAGLAGAFGEWCVEPLGSLARVILLDQFTRNAFRDTPDAFAGDPRALATTLHALERNFDAALDPYERWFLYMPLEHAEDLALQERAVELFTALARDTGVDSPLPWVERHRDVIRRFGRFPHRNEILGRTSTPEELAFLQEPGSRF